MVIDEYEIQGVYYISNGEQELAKDYERAKKVAEERGLPLKERDMSKYREQLGLEPITETNQRILFRNILQKSYKGNEELISKYYRYEEEFITRNYKEFYERYMTIKHQEKFSVDDIWKIFADIARKDMNFNWIAQEYDGRHMTPEEKETLRIMQEYGITGITDRENLQKRLEHIISDGIQYSSSQSEYGDKKFAEIKQVLPQFEEFKEVYLQLRQYGIEEKLYERLDFKNINYEELLKRAENIIEEKTKKEELQQTGQAEQEKSTVEQTNDEVIINEFREIIRPNNTDKTSESQSVEEQIEESTTNEEIKVQQLEKVKTKEESTKDEIGDRTDKENNTKMQERETPEVNLWMNRFSSWYSVIDRVSQNVKVKLIKMKSNIIKTISDILHERAKGKENNKEQEK